MQHTPKKSLGQNFLKSKSVLQKIAEAGEIQKKDLILEIGPGKGALTEVLLQKECKVVAVEKDRDLASFLREKFKKELKNGKLTLIEGDILDFDFKNHTNEYSFLLKNDLNYKIIANIPYNITGAILKKFLTGSTKSSNNSENSKNSEKLNDFTSFPRPKRMILMVQHEVAKRILDKKGSLLSISVKVYGNPRLVMKVGARYFSPAPKVDSAVISITNISKDFFTKNNLDEQKFWEVVKLGFAHKRKQLLNNLKSLNLNDKEWLKNKRAEDLELSDWVRITKDGFTL